MAIVVHIALHSVISEITGYGHNHGPEPAQLTDRASLQLAVILPKCSSRSKTLISLCAGTFAVEALERKLVTAMNLESLQFI